MVIVGLFKLRRPIQAYESDDGNRRAEIIHDANHTNEDYVEVHITGGPLGGLVEMRKFQNDSYGVIKCLKEWILNGYIMTNKDIQNFNKGKEDDRPKNT